jgi:hypothetical protein
MIIAQGIRYPLVNQLARRFPQSSLADFPLRLSPCFPYRWVPGQIILAYAPPQILVIALWNPILRQSPEHSPQPERFPSFLILFDGNPHIKRAVSMAILDGRKPLAQPPRAGEQINNWNAGFPRHLPYPF